MSSAHRFAVGDHVRIVEENSEGNPRTPRYARGRIGVVEQLHGVIVNPLDHADPYPPLCTLVLGVESSAAGDVIALDIHEDWLQAAER